ncbi:MAG: hypothetical protein AB2660_05225 [Candidatus Thiodiazotropha sp.]|nr:MAG: hypothetical protein DBO99_06910 [gamma proteobacterium symbiont of Ctena orbiculata]
MNEHNNKSVTGYTDANAVYKLSALLSGSLSFGLFAAQDDAGNRFLATTTLKQTASHEEVHRKLVYDVEGIAPLVYIGRLHAAKPTDFDLMIEQMPLGIPSHLVGKGIAEPATVARLGASIAAAVERLHAQRQPLLCLRPQSIYVMDEGDSNIQLTGMAPRAECFYFSAEKPDLHTPLAFDDTFVAPEVLLGLEPDSKADLFSLCAIMAFWLTGRSPFDGKGYLGHVKGIMRNKRAYHLPADELGQLLESGLDSQVANRPKFSELKHGLRSIAEKGY